MFVMILDISCSCPPRIEPYLVHPEYLGHLVQVDAAAPRPVLLLHLAEWRQCSCLCMGT